MGFFAPDLPEDASVTVSKEQWDGTGRGKVTTFLVGMACGAVLWGCVSTDGDAPVTPTSPTSNPSATSSRE